MPFDGADAPRIVALEKLDRVAELLGDEKRWCKGALVNRNGQICLMEALRRAASEAELKPVILNAVAEVTGRTFRTVESFNDHAGTSHATLVAVLQRTRRDIETGQYPPAQMQLRRAGLWHGLWQGLRARMPVTG